MRQLANSLEPQASKRARGVRVIPPACADPILLSRLLDSVAREHVSTQHRGSRRRGEQLDQRFEVREVVLVVVVPIGVDVLEVLLVSLQHRREGDERTGDRMADDKVIDLGGRG